MNDVFNDLLKAYYTALSSVGTPAYSSVMPRNPPNTYILFQPIFAIADESKTESGQNARMQISIIDNNETGTFSNINAIAESVFGKIYPKPNFKLPSTNNFVINLEMDKFITLPLGSRVQVQRVLLFSHKF